MLHFESAQVEECSPPLEEMLVRRLDGSHSQNGPLHNLSPVILFMRILFL